MLLLMTLYIFESSAYKYISELGSSAAQSSGRSFMYIKNNRGPNMLRCGIPLSTLNQDDCSHSALIEKNHFLISK